MPKVTVLMSTYNGERFLKEAIESILNQTFPDFEYFIYDDGSNDSTRAIIQSYDDPRIRIFVNKNRRGLTANLQAGLEAATSEYVARMDADDVSNPLRLQIQSDFLDQNADVALVGSSYNVINAAGQHLRSWFPPCDAREIHSQLLKRNCIAHPSIMFRKTAVQSVGGYMERAGPYAQDYDLFLRLSDHYQLVNIPRPLIQYRVHENQISAKKIIEQTRSAKIYSWMATERRSLRGESVDARLLKPNSLFMQKIEINNEIACAYLEMEGNLIEHHQRALAWYACMMALRYSPLHALVWERLIIDRLIGDLVSNTAAWWIKKLIRKACFVLPHL